MWSRNFFEIALLSAMSATRASAPRLEAREMDHGLQAVLALVCQHCSSSARTGPLARLCDALRKGDGVEKVHKIDN